MASFGNNKTQHLRTEYNSIHIYTYAHIRIKSFLSNHKMPRIIDVSYSVIIDASLMLALRIEWAKEWNIFLNLLKQTLMNLFSTSIEGFLFFFLNAR